MTTLIPQATPWRPLPNREMSDAEGNIIQYTQENIGMICLTVNHHKKLMEAMVKIETLVGDSPDILAVIREATGRIGSVAVAVLIEAAADPSPELDRAIAADLQIPEMQFTSNTDMAMALTPPGWTMGFMPYQKAANMPDGGDALPTEGPSMAVTFSGPDGKTVTSIHKHLQMAICAGAMRARSE